MSLETDNNTATKEEVNENLITNHLIERMLELAAERNAQLDGLPEAIADANKPTEIMETSFQTLGDIMATIAAGNREEDPLMEALLEASQATAANTLPRAGTPSPTNGG